MSTTRKLDTYFDNNPLGVAADHFGLDWDDDILPVTGGDHHVSVEETRRWQFGNVVVAIYRMVSGRYELTAYAA